MIVYNVTVSIESSIAEDWLKWMKDVHIPDVMETGKFTGQNLFKLISEEEEQNTYSIQYSCDNIDDYNDYAENYAPKLQAEHNERYKDKYVAFRSILERI